MNRNFFSIKTKDPEQVKQIKSQESDIVISNLNVHNDKIRINDFVFVVFGGDKPTDWNPGLVALGYISKTPYNKTGKNFQVKINITLYFEPITRKDLLPYPDTYGIIGIAPIVKWEPNQALSLIPEEKAEALLQALLELRFNNQKEITEFIGEELFKKLSNKSLHRYIVTNSQLYSKKFTIQESTTHTAPSSKQIIYYGAPGTGKSYKIKEILKNISSENIYRTTFHPDSDYSTFVGAYKPTMKKKNNSNYSKSDLIKKLSNLKSSGTTYPCQKFGAIYWESIQSLSANDIKEILLACDFTEPFYQEINKGVSVGEELQKDSNDSSIIYSFAPQAFVKAYIKAYQTKENVYLVIEEINRGNCAQIFGDLFQLLDRDQNGFSEYPIKADNDLKDHLEKILGENKPGILKGELCLPPNLYIYATMNTSDQSLFPIDSAFKRRWDWEYEPIKNNNTNWEIHIQDQKYSWAAFQKEVNKRIYDISHSEDKMLGDFFVNPRDGIITEKILVNKILFYLWNDVCKDGDGDIFKISETKEVTFSDLYGENGSETLIGIMKHLKLTPIPNDEDLDKEIENNEAELKKEQKLADWYEKLWKEVEIKLSDLGLQNRPSAGKRAVYQISVGLTGISILSTYSKTKGICRVCYYIEKSEAEILYPKLQKLKDIIETELQTELEWQHKEDSHAEAKISKQFNDLDNLENRNHFIDWVSEKLHSFYSVLNSNAGQLK